jgi:hypothetical protein
MTVIASYYYNEGKRVKKVAIDERIAHDNGHVRQ